MSRLIDADELTEKAWRYGLATREDIAQMIANAPTVDAVPLEDYKSMESTVNKLTQALANSEKHGHWITWFENEDVRQAKCSECGMVFTLGKGRDIHYCGNCGAKMNEVEDE